jgi:hypothetical protein
VCAPLEWPNHYFVSFELLAPSLNIIDHIRRDYAQNAEILSFFAVSDIHSDYLAMKASIRTDFSRENPLIVSHQKLVLLNRTVSLSHQSVELNTFLLAPLHKAVPARDRKG